MARESSTSLRFFITFSGVCGLIALVGAWIAQGTAILSWATDPTVPQSSDFYQYTFARFEPFALYTSATFFLGLYFLLPKISTSATKSPSLLAWKNLPALIALGVLLATCIGRFTVHHNFDLCTDEYLNDFEAGILDRNHVVATVPTEWRDYESALAAPYEKYNAKTGCWASGFLPGFASLDFLFGKMGISWALSPLLCALSLLLLASLARKAFPELPVLAGNVAVLILAATPQFLAMGMTKFAWTAHLFGSLLWVWLFVHPNRFLFLLTPILGALLIGLHQPHVHPLVAAPFVIRLLRDGRWRDFVWFLAWYVIGAFGWYQIFNLLRPEAFAGGGDLNPLLPASSSFIVSALLSLIFATFHAFTFFAWMTPVLAPFLGNFLVTWKTQPTIARDAFVAACLTFLFYLFFPHVQGHGWGFRFIHSAYGLLALAATGGAVALHREGRSAPMAKALVASVAFGVFVQVPYRIHEIRAMVVPLARTWNYISRQPTDFVVIKTSEFWYSWDLIRNDPWLQKKPLIFDEARLSPSQKGELSRKGTITVVGAEQVKDFGVILSDPNKATTH
jgi:hypothetical protein